MKKFNIFFILTGAGGTKEVPNTSNPVEAESVQSVLGMLRENFPNFNPEWLWHVGVKIVEVSNDSPN
jgi:hypothetical protein